MSVSLKGRTAIVTGAAVGIGNAYAKAMAKEGCNVAVIDLRAEITSLAGELEKYGVKAYAVQGDVSQPATVRKFVDDVIGRFGGVDILINNAGQCSVSLIDDDLDKTEADYESMVGTNLRGEYLMGRAVIAQLLSRAAAGRSSISAPTMASPAARRASCARICRPVRGAIPRGRPAAVPSWTSMTPANTAPMP